MRYDFDSVTDRSGTYSYKWDIPQGELPMWVADMDFRTAPEITEALVKRAQHGVFGYSTLPPEWSAAYRRWWRERHGIDYDDKMFIFATGVIPIISSCVRKLTTPAENVVIMTPVYNIFYNCIRNNGRNVLECPLDYKDGEYSVDMERLGAALADPQTTLLLLCDPQNPAGKLWDRETLAKIGELAYDNGVTVISDEIHCDLTDPGASYVPFASASEKCFDNCVVCVAPTKAFNLAGIQTAAAVVPNRRLRHKVWRALNTDECAEPNSFAVTAAVAAFEKGGEWLDQLREYIYGSKQIVGGFLRENIPEIRLVESQATYLLWLDCAGLGMPIHELWKLIRRETGLFLSDGSIYGGGNTHLRMNIACPRSMLRDGLDRLARAAQTVREMNR